MAKKSPVTQVTIGAGKDADKSVRGNSAAARYEQLMPDRDPFRLRAEQNAKVTIPYLFPPMGHNGSTLLPTPYQGTGARGVNNLAAKLLLALMPPNAAFFRYQVDDFELQKMAGQPGMRALVEKGLASVERAVMTEIETSGIRVPFFEALKQLVVAGNALCYLKPDGGMKVFRLDRYVVRRDTMGRLLEILVKEDVSRSALTQEQQFAFYGPGTQDPESPSHSEDIALYTWVCLDRKAKQWTIHQEINNKVVPGSEGTYPTNKSPWFPLRWTKIDNEDYGRAYVEEYLGDLKTLESLTRAITEGAAAMARMVILVSPNGSTRIQDIAEAPNGSARIGNEADVTVLQMSGKAGDFKVAQELADQITQRLSFAFLLNSSVQRNGERVTAEEIRFMAGELEDALGGVYSILTQEFQLPFVVCLIYQMERDKKLPQLPHDLMKPTITTGIEAIGRGQDVNRLQQFLQALGTLGPLAPQALQYINISDFITRIGTSMNIDMDGLVKPEQQVQEEQAAANQTNFANNVAPHIVKGISDNLKQHLAGQQQGPAAPPQGQPSNG